MLTRRRFETRKNVTPKSPVLYLLVLELTQNKGWSNRIRTMRWWLFGISCRRLTHCTFGRSLTTVHKDQDSIQSRHFALKKNSEKIRGLREGQIIIMWVSAQFFVASWQKYIIFQGCFLWSVFTLLYSRNSSSIWTCMNASSAWQYSV